MLDGPRCLLYAFVWYDKRSLYQKNCRNIVPLRWLCPFPFNFCRCDAFCSFDLSFSGFVFFGCACHLRFSIFCILFAIIRNVVAYNRTNEFRPKSISQGTFDKLYITHSYFEKYRMQKNTRCFGIVSPTHRLPAHRWKVLILLVFFSSSLFSVEIVVRTMPQTERLPFTFDSLLSSHDCFIVLLCIGFPRRLFLFGMLGPSDTMLQFDFIIIIIK